AEEECAGRRVEAAACQTESLFHIQVAAAAIERAAALREFAVESYSVATAVESPAALGVGVNVREKRKVDAALIDRAGLKSQCLPVQCPAARRLKRHIGRV